MQRATSVIPVGVLSTMAVIGADEAWNNPIFFVASGNTVRALSGYETQKISTPDVERFVTASERSSLRMLVFGRDFAGAFREVLGDRAKSIIVAEATYDFTDPTVDSQMVKLANSGANVFFNISIGKYASQSMKKVGELNWNPLHYIISTSANAMLMKAAGEGGLKGAVSLQSNKRAGSPRWSNDPDLMAYEAFRAKYTPTVNPGDDAGFYAYAGAALLAEILRDCGDDLTRENLMRLATNLKGRRTAYMLPSLTLSTTPDNYEPVTTFYLATYDGWDWKLSEQPFRE